MDTKYNFEEMSEQSPMKKFRALISERYDINFNHIHPPLFQCLPKFLKNWSKNKQTKGKEVEQISDFSLHYFFILFFSKYISLPAEWFLCVSMQSACYKIKSRPGPKEKMPEDGQEYRKLSQRHNFP